MILYIVTAVVVIVLMIYIIKALWSVSAMLVIPLQIILFLILAFLVFKIFFTKENVQKISTEIDKSGIIQAGQSTIEETVRKNIQNNTDSDGSESEKQPETVKQPEPQKQPEPSPANTVKKSGDSKEDDFFKMDVDSVF